MSDQTEPRRSRRRAYVSLEALQQRARAVASAEEHDAFWGDGGANDDDDDSYNSEDASDKEDIIDSDFDDPEEADDDDDNEDGVGDVNNTSGAVKKKTSAAEAAIRAEERRSARRDRPNKYVDPALQKKIAAKGVSANKLQVESKPKTVQPAIPLGVAGTRTSLRKSTKAASARAAEERARRRVDEEARRKQKALRDAERVPTRPMTQEERLEEAKLTEELNKDSLKDLLRMEEEKKRAVTTNKRELGPVISFRSRNGVSSISLSKGVDVTEALFPQVKNSTEAACPDVKGIAKTDSKNDEI